MTVTQFKQQGFLFPITVLSRDEVANALASLRELEARTQTSMPRIPSLHRFFEWAFRIAAHPNLLNPVEEVLGEDILVWGTLVLAKPPDGRTFISWHQDNPYAGFLDGSPSVTAWVALTPATRASGCMRIIPGLQDGVLPFSTDKHPDDMLKRGLELTGRLDEEKAVDVELRPGEASLHEISVIHGSHANCSDETRIGFIVRYATPAMKPPPFPIYCVRGDSGVLAVSDPPRESDQSFDAYCEYLRLDAATPGGAN